MLRLGSAMLVVLAMALWGACDKSAKDKPAPANAPQEGADQPKADQISSEERCRRAIERAFDLKLEASGASDEAKAQVAPDRERSVLGLVPKCLAALESHDEGEETGKALDCILAAKDAEQAKVCGLL